MDRILSKNPLSPFTVESSPTAAINSTLPLLYRRAASRWVGLRSAILLNNRSFSTTISRVLVSSGGSLLGGILPFEMRLTRACKARGRRIRSWELWICVRSKAFWRPAPSPWQLTQLFSKTGARTSVYAWSIPEISNKAPKETCPSSLISGIENESKVCWELVPTESPDNETSSKVLE